MGVLIYLVIGFVVTAFNVAYNKVFDAKEYKKFLDDNKDEEYLLVMIYCVMAVIWPLIILYVIFILLVKLLTYILELFKADKEEEE